MSIQSYLQKCFLVCSYVHIIQMPHMPHQGKLLMRVDVLSSLSLIHCDVEVFNGIQLTSDVLTEPALQGSKTFFSSDETKTSLAAFGGAAAMFRIPFASTISAEVSSSSFTTLLLAQEHRATTDHHQ